MASNDTSLYVLQMQGFIILELFLSLWLILAAVWMFVAPNLFENFFAIILLVFLPVFIVIVAKGIADLHETTVIRKRDPWGGEEVEYTRRLENILLVALDFLIILWCFTWFQRNYQLVKDNKKDDDANLKV